ncbi:MAG: hypothetical protein LBP56_01920 [Odoribacteraceae bacterium]|jgi:hypothetical protein|nr:hypothetical protein [Odoribacteraceae bacterium]
MTYLITFLLVGLAVVGLGISIFFTKKRAFPETHIGRNKAMRERGVRCAITADREEQAKKRDSPLPPVTD